ELTHLPLINALVVTCIVTCVSATTPTQLQVHASIAMRAAQADQARSFRSLQVFEAHFEIHIQRTTQTARRPNLVFLHSDVADLESSFHRAIKQALKARGLRVTLEVVGAASQRVTT